MTLQQQIWRSSDADLASDLARYRQSIDDNQMPEMIRHWNEAVQMIEHEIEQRMLHASAARGLSPAAIQDESTF